MDNRLTAEEVADIYERYGSLLLQRCRRILRDDALADDAMQEAFVNLIRYGAKFRAAEAKLRWLYRLTDRCCFGQLNRRRTLSERERGGELPEVSGVPVPHEARDRVMRILGALNEMERKLAVLAYVDEFSQGEIGTETGWSRQTINKKLKAIRAKAQVLETST
ncbi:MAG: sigma-70 family RNA polymerase sigma factor [Myxococcota bacterium]